MSGAGAGQAERAMTLIELALAVSLVGLLAVMAAPRMLDLDAVRCRRAANALCVSIRHGQIQAMQSETAVSLGFTGQDNTQFFIQDAAGNPLPDLLTGQPAGTGYGSDDPPWDLSADVDRITTDLEDDRLWFLPGLGEPAHGAGSPTTFQADRRITLEKGTHQDRVLIHPQTGFVEVEP
ncbi:MAG: type II secretion system protein [bacterium]